MGAVGGGGCAGLVLPGRQGADEVVGAILEVLLNLEFRSFNEWFGVSTIFIVTMTRVAP